MDHAATSLRLQDAVFCIAYASDGSRFASGGADNTVIIWSSHGQGLLKYTHSSTIQALAYNPVTQQLASASETDFGIWSPEVRSVPKRVVSSRARCLAWTPDGQQLAVGLEDGSVQIRDKAGEPRGELPRAAHPIWSLAFSPATDARTILLAVASWDGKLSTYEVRVTPGCHANSPECAKKKKFNACFRLSLHIHVSVCRSSSIEPHARCFCKHQHRVRA